MVHSAFGVIIQPDLRDDDIKLVAINQARRRTAIAWITWSANIPFVECLGRNFIIERPIQAQHFSVKILNYGGLYAYVGYQAAAFTLN